MKKKLFIILSVALFITLSATAQIRPYVGIVRQQYDEKFINMMNDYKDELRNSGYSTYAKYVDAYLKGGFGSGFIYVAPDGTNYLITNHHVVPQAATVSVEFEDADTGNITKYEGLTVLATDDDIDIAICVFPEGKRPFKTGLKFSTANLKDGDDVYTAGFPGLGSEPVWQFGKGIVTNSKVRIKEMLDPSISTLIQHSAQVDSGNSGGPLLVVDKSAPSGYAVVGINTWKANYRDSTNYSIPAKTIQDFINKSISNKGKAISEETAKARSSKFVDPFTSSDQKYSSIINFISYDFAIEYGKTAFTQVNRFAPSSVRNEIMNIYAYNPMEGLRYSVAYSVWSKFRPGDCESAIYKLSSIEKTDDGFKMVFDCEVLEKTFITEWKAEHGLLRMVSCETPESLKAKENPDKKKKERSSSGEFKLSSPDISSMSFVDLRLGCDIPLNTAINGNYPPCFGLNLTGTVFLEYFGFLLGLDNEFINMSTIIFPNVGIALRIPVNMNSFGITPFANVAAGFVINQGHGLFNFALGYGVSSELGLIFEFDCGSEVFPGFGVAYKATYISTDDAYESSSTDSKINYLKHGINIFFRLGI